MKRIFLIAGILMLFSFTKQLTSESVLQKMYNRYGGKWFKTLSFNQTTERYRNDSLVKTETWYENVIYPNLFRIDFGDPAKGNAVIYKGDSSFFFKNGQLQQAAKDRDELTFFLGGMYFTSFNNVIASFKALNYDLGKFHEDTWKGKPVYVIGANSAGEKVNQLWVDKDMLVPVRFFKYENNRKEEGTFENQVKMDNGWSETYCRFYFNDKLIQAETYHDVVAGKPIDEKIFDPAAFITWQLKAK
ncbi:MAG TPA: hypothetical protein VG738_22080 [Chitinophagaceae bacterium]|nr:hypothetical protein [Chitinophagaceae bacterium]